jgi:hypothetical protein
MVALWLVELLAAKAVALRCEAPVVGVVLVATDNGGWTAAVGADVVWHAPDGRHNTTTDANGRFSVLLMARMSYFFEVSYDPLQYYVDPFPIPPVQPVCGHTTFIPPNPPFRALLIHPPPFSLRVQN